MYENTESNKHKSYSLFTQQPTPTQPTTIEQHDKHSLAVADTGSTELLLRQSSEHYLEDRVPYHGLEVTVANKALIRSIAKGILRIPAPSGDILVPGYVFPDGILSNNLASLSYLCSQGCTVTLTNTDINVIKDATSVWGGTKATADKLWHLSLADIPMHPPMQRGTTLQAIRLDSDAEYVAFSHAALASPPITTLIRAVEMNYLSNFPKLTARMIRANPTVSRATAMGYLDQTRQGQHSTKPSPARSTQTASAGGMNDDDENDSSIKYQVLPVTEILTNASDATGRFPFPTRSGYNYLLVSTMNGYVHLELMTSRNKKEYLRVYKATYDFYESHRKKPTNQRLDNETSFALEDFLRMEQVDVQFAPPGIHRQNPAERAIRHVKNTLIAMCTTADPAFPAENLFEDAIPQAEIVLNILRPWHPDRTINAWTGMHNQPYDHMARPLSIYGMKVVVHDKPGTRGTWAAYGTDGFYVGPAMRHYRNYRCYMPATRSIRISDTIAWLPLAYTMPGHSPLEVLNAAVADLTSAIKQMSSTDMGVLDAHLTTENTTMAQHLTSAVHALRERFYPAADAPASRAEQTPTGATEITAAPQRVEVTAAPQRVEVTAAPQRVDSIMPPLTVDSTSLASPSTSSPPITQRLQSTRSSQSTTKSSKWEEVVSGQSDSRRTTAEYLRHINKTVDGARVISGIDRDVSSSSGTLYYRLDIPGQKLPIRIPCHRLLRDRTALWKRTSITPGIAMTATTPSILNLNEDGSPLTYASALASDHAAEWQLANDEEMRKLVTATQTMKPIHKSHIPADRRRDVAYYNPQVKEKIKDGKYVRRVRGTIGGDRTNFTGAVSARTASLEVVRTLLNSVLADDAEFMCCDITDYYLGTPMKRSEYMRVHRRQLSAPIIAELDLEPYLCDDIIHFEVTKGMYGLPQAGLLAQKRLVSHLATHGYIESDAVPCLFRHATNGITFVLVVDDFGIKFKGAEGRDHLLNTLRLLYTITVDNAGSQYLGMAIDHDKSTQTITISMPGYIAKVLARFHALIDGTSNARSPGTYTQPQYGAKIQYEQQDESRPLTAAEKTLVQEVVGSFLYYARAVDPTMLQATNKIASEQAQPTQHVMDQVIHLLRYAATYPDNAIRFRKSKMHLILQADASYLSRSKARSVAGGVAYFGDSDDPTTENGIVHAISSIIDVVVSSAGESEYGAAFIIAQNGVSLRNIATAMGHAQPATPLLGDNKFAIGLGSDTIKQRRSKSIDMRFHWLRDRIRQGQFVMHYLATDLLLADFFTKTLPTKAHQAIMPRLVHVPKTSHAMHTSGEWHQVRYKRGRLCPIKMNN